METVTVFMERMDAAAAELLEPRDANGHPDLPEYDPAMGPRYSIKSHSLPLSVFRGEGIALYMLTRLLQPSMIAECYTGTGYAACCLAAGTPYAPVYTVDNYTEGNLGEAGLTNAIALRDRLKLDNLNCLYGTVETLNQTIPAPVSLYLSDGPYGESPQLTDSAIHIRHDDSSGQIDGQRIALPGGSHMSITCPTVEMRDWLMEELRPYVQVRAV